MGSEMVVVIGAALVNLGIVAAWWAIGSARSAEGADPRDRSLAAPAARRLADGLGSALGRLAPGGPISRRRRRLDAAGWLTGRSVERWWGVRGLGALALGGTGAVAGVVLGTDSPVLVIAIGALVGWLGPEAWLAQRVEGRRREIARHLADLVDQLAVMVRAGLSVDAALARAAQGATGVLAEELGRVVQQRRLGASRADALGAMATRLDLHDMTAVVAALAQAEDLGVPVADALEVQSDYLRVRRRQRAQERAMTLPVRLLFPLVVCVFPALLVVLLGPAVLSILRGW